jgi:hypothetical protein
VNPDIIGLSITTLVYGWIIRDNTFMGYGGAILVHQVIVTILKGYGL